VNIKPTPPTPTGANADASARSARRKPGTWRKAIPYVIGGAILIFIVTGLMPKPVPVDTATVAPGSLTVSVLEEGKTRIRHRYVVSPSIAGFLNRVELRAGAPIEKGKTVLATIQPLPSSFLDPRGKAEAEAGLKVAEAAKLRSTADLERARAALDLAEKEKVRAESLRDKGVLSTKEWDTAENQAVVLGRGVRSAEFGLQVAEFQRAQAEASLMQLEKPAGERSDPFKMLAPVSGFILNVYEENARAITPGTPIMELGDTADMEVEIELLSTDAVAVRTGAPVSIEQWGDERPLRGRVALVEPGGYTKVSALGVEEQRVKVRVEFVDPIPPGLLLGDRYRVEGRIVTWQGDNVLQAPTGALFRRGGDWMTFVLEGGKARLVKVEIAHNNGVEAEIRSGLKAGQRIILHPPDTVADGASVKPR